MKRQASPPLPHTMVLSPPLTWLPALFRKYVNLMCGPKTFSANALRAFIAPFCVEKVVARALGIVSATWARVQGLWRHECSRQVCSCAKEREKRSQRERERERGREGEGGGLPVSKETNCTNSSPRSRISPHLTWQNKLQVVEEHCRVDLLSRISRPPCSASRFQTRGTASPAKD